MMMMMMMRFARGKIRLAAFDGPSPKTPLAYRRKNLADISYTDRVIVNFVAKFVAMATGVGRKKILMTPSDSTGLKIGDRCKQRAIVFYGG